MMRQNNIDANRTFPNHLIHQPSVNTVVEKPKRVAIYARDSFGSRDANRTTINNQIDMFEAYVEERGWEVFKIYRDNKSGTKTNNREVFEQLLDDARHNRFDVIVAKELSRLARNGQLSYMLRDICREHHVDIVCLDGSINTLEDNSDKFGLYVYLYENESQTNSRRSKQAKRAKAARGRFTGSNPPYGYQCIDGKLHIREDHTPEVIRRIFTMYLAGDGVELIAKTLTREGVPSPGQVANRSNATGTWHGSTITLILKNVHYCGHLVQNQSQTISLTSHKRASVAIDEQIYVPNTHEAIIQEAVFQQVKERMEQRSIGPRPKQAKRFFTNLIYCPHCGSGMWYRANTKDYRCGGHLKYGDERCESNVGIKEDALKSVIIEDLRGLMTTLNHDDFVTQYVERKRAEQTKFTTERTSIERQMEAEREKKRRYVDLFAENHITKQELSDFRTQADANLARLDAELSKVSRLIELTNDSHEHYIRALRRKLQEVLSLAELPKSIIQSLVKRITFSKEKELSLEYTFANPFEENDERQPSTED